MKEFTIGANDAGQRLDRFLPSLPLGGKMTLLKSNKSPMNSKIFLKFQEKNQIFS
jgi:hypothetical protein